MEASSASGVVEQGDSALLSESVLSALEQALVEVEQDERTVAMIAATRLRLRIELTDSDVGLDLTAGADGRLRWSFGESASEPKLTLSMSSAVANRYLLGRDSLPIAIVRGDVRVRGESKMALLCLPAAQLLAEPYRKVVEALYPDLATA